MSMRDFLDGECGQNPVLKVASHFTRDLAPSTSRQFDDGSGQDVSLLPPTTFQMDDLLKEIQSVSYNNKGPIQAPGIAELAMQPEWAQEFRNEQQFPPRGGGESQESWIQDYMSKELELDSVWDHSHHLPSGIMHPHQNFYPHHHPPQMQPLLPHPMSTRGSHSQSGRELLDDSKWTAEYAPPEPNLLEKTELMATAEEFLKSVADPKIKATEFMSYVEKLSTGEISADGQTPLQKSAEWATEYENALRASAGDEFLVSDANGAVGGSTEESKEQFWQKLNEEWQKMAEEDSPLHPWLTGTSQGKLNEPYQFAEENAFQSSSDPFEEGKRKLLEGDIPSAALLFEAAVLQTPEHPESWAYLGTTQALNEQDALSIAALNKCLEFQPNNLNALMSLATSLTNESYYLQACNALKRWLKYNDKYSHLVNEDLNHTLPQTSILPGEELAKVQRQFIQAARQNSSGVDPDVQCGLGILFNLDSDFEKAADCFQAALGANPHNALWWNRLGATLANGGKSSEAIGAYRRALELSPGYVRTRYNLGIACVNLGAYKEAAEHFLTSLNMQANSGSSSQEQKGRNIRNMSESIWASLRTSIHLLNMTPLLRFIDSRDLDGLNREFNLGS